jgi:hypothetical protein
MGRATLEERVGALTWAQIGDRALDIHPEMEFFFDVFKIESHDNSLRPNTTLVPIAWAELLREPGKYRFHVVVSGDNIKPVPQAVDFEWKGSFDLVTENSF